MELSGEMKNSQQKRSCTEKLCDTTNDDRLSSLPWHIERRIISFLPMADAVRMSCLSKKWRAKCYSLPNLIFIYREYPQLERKLDRFVEFVSHTISLHDESEIETFKLSILVDDTSHGCNLEWIKFTLQHKVKFLALFTQIGEKQRLPSCLFISKLLQILHLGLNGQVLKLPTKISLPNLTELALAYSFLDDADLTQNFFSNCPLLEILTLHYCNLFNLKWLSISSPKLEYLKISNCYGVNECKINLLTPSLLHFLYDSDVAEEICLKNDSSMYKASIVFQAPTTRVITNSQLNCALKLMEGLRHVSNLVLSEWFIEFLFFKGHGPLKNLFASGFRGPETLKLHIWPEKDHIQKVISLLGMFRGIRELDIVISSVSSWRLSRFTINSKLWNGTQYQVWPPNMPSLELNSQELDVVDFPNLELVFVHDFGGHDCVLEVMEFLLIKARVLKEMMIFITHKVDDTILPEETKERACTRNTQKLEVFSKAFPNVPIDIY